MKNQHWVLLFALLALWAGVIPAGHAVASDQNVSAGQVGAAFDLYGKLSAKQGNLFFSPFSISSAMGMVQAGARGETLAQMNRALHFGPKTHEEMLAMRRSFAAAPEEAGQLHVANSIWPSVNYPFLPSYIALLKDYYGVEVKPQNYKQNAEKARLLINHWVEEKTQDRIRDILQEGSLNSDTRLVLVNAIYFKAAWAYPFPEKETKNDFFYSSPNKAKLVRMMNQTETFEYKDAGDAAILKLPYKEGLRSMLVVLPKEKHGLAALEQKLSPQLLHGWLQGMKPTRVQVALPRFEMEDDFNLKAPLSALGMKDAFIPRVADFSGMDGSRKLNIDLIIHKAFIAVTEKETEAAAATVVVMRAMAMLPVDPVLFRADHPFLFLIRDETTGAILFMGRMTEPKEPKK